ncbi:nucleolar complex protein [Aureobasidium pullulans]|uniref:Nucleolar complex protein n=1 Tax=Aureobasidium pullulans TaxID=5580 RepID=A0A4T0F559_AURPU|nr:nucleolar complex protein [Aureobasidium pullulans]THW49273.1 nucleolar complex protein [Aureobasidium pullulans]THX96865.1 nucleolar complex protein [Aureobasidium pullulans]THZ51485.1 nucleolar complex protein [Aureobasidium pullulans]TIA66337.1 nucleolar complex protein [Aureobasidium pullulans]
MPGLVEKKRKRTDAAAVAKPTKSKKVKAASKDDGENDPQAQMLLLEQQILESPSNYPNITSLLKFLKSKDATQKVTAAVALCRVFCRLMAAERMVKQKTMDEEEIEQVDWLKTQYKEYGRQLGRLLASEELQSTSLTLLMRLVKEETSQDGRRAEQAWRTGIFADLVLGLVASPDAAGAREEFMENFVEEHDDVRYFTFYAVANILARSPEGYDRQTLVSNALSLLLLIENAPDSDSQLEDWYGQTPEGRKHALLSLTSHRKTAQEAWLAIFRSAMTKDERKSILHHLTTRIVPWFTKPESLMDFLTDSYDAGGATSLLALSGLFYLIAEKNLDYPAFYTKLYSLLDDTLLHSKHRSRFFRLLETFMSSTHLPSAMVASFIKRLSRLALHAPPAAIVVVIPWVYNMLLRHRTCTFMIHREVRGAAQLKKLEAEGMDDPFSMDQLDPMETNAIDSSLWELETLASHYHPNVATLARIIQEQFTKKNYNMEDFLDHNYQGLIDAELGKEMRKTPVVEFEIPKRIITVDEGGLNDLGGLLQTAVEAL